MLRHTWSEGNFWSRRLDDQKLKTIQIALVNIRTMHNTDLIDCIAKNYYVQHNSF